MTKQLLDAITEIMNRAKMPCDKTFPTVAYGKDEKGKYNIVFEDRLRSVDNALPCDIPMAALVWVKIPNGKLKDMHICGLRNKY